MVLTIQKAKSRPIGSISPDRKTFKNSQGKWVPRKKQNIVKKKSEIKLKLNTKAKYYDPKVDWKKNGVKSKIFKEWFGDWEHGEGSQVTTKTGKPEKQFNTGIIEPIKMYHGTGSGHFSEFDLGHSNTGVLLYGGGFYFTANKDVAETYQTNNKSEIFNFNAKFTIAELTELHKVSEATAYASAKKYLPDPLGSIADKTMFLQTLAYMFNREDLDRYTGFGKELRSKFHEMKDDLSITTTDESQLFEVYLNIRKPFDVDNDTIDGKKLGLTDKPYTYMQAMETMHFKKYHKPTTPVGEKLAEFKDKIQGVLKGMGYDGITHIGGRIVGRGETPEHRVWIAFNAEDIKSADNEGTFDNKQKNIYKSLQKARKMSIGTVSHGRKKVAENKWVPVKKIVKIKGLDLDAFEIEKLDMFVKDQQETYIRIQSRLKDSNLSKIMRGRYEWQRESVKRAKNIVTAIKKGEVRFHDPNSEKGDSAVIHKSSRLDWKWQISYFDERGPFHHDSGNDLNEILIAMETMGHFVPGKPKKGLLKSVRLVVPFIKSRKKSNTGAVSVWSDGTTHQKMANGKWRTVSNTRSRKQDKPKVAQKKLEITVGKRDMLGQIKLDYEASIEDNSVGFVIGGLLEYQFGVKDYDALSKLVAKSNRGKLSEIFRTIKDAVDVMNEDPKKGKYVTRGQKRFHVDMLGQTLLKLKQIHTPEKERLTVPVKLKTGNIKGVYVKPVVGIPAIAMKEARAMTGGWKSGKHPPTTEQVKEMLKLKNAKMISGKIDPKLKWSIKPLAKNTLVPFRVEETGISVKIQQYKKEKGRKRGYGVAIVDLHVPYAYAISFLKHNMKSVRTRNELIGLMERSKGYRKIILKEKGLK